MDWSLLQALNGFLYHHDTVEDPLLVFIEASEALFAGTLLLVFIAAHGARHRAWRRAAVAAVLSAGLALGIGKVISELVDRARPFVADPGAVHLFTHHSPDPSFPSDHATAAFAIAVAIMQKSGVTVPTLFALVGVATLAVALAIWRTLPNSQ